MIIINSTENVGYCIDNEIKNHGNQYIQSIEYIDNRINEVIIKINYKHCVVYRNLKGELHNPIGPAYNSYINGKIESYNYYINGCYIPKKEFKESVKKLYK